MTRPAIAAPGSSSATGSSPARGPSIATSEPAAAPDTTVARAPFIAMVAGEMSGDLLGARLMRTIRDSWPEARFSGIGGPEMLAHGFHSFVPIERLSVMGLFEAAGRFAELVPERRRLARRLVAAAPDVFVGIDAPDFNLSLERRLRASGIPTVHYVSPSMWAWRAYRAAKVRKAVDRILTLFPFEAEFCRRNGISARYVGHPLARELEHEERAAVRLRLGLPDGVPIVALLPGSRAREVRDIGRPFLETAAWLHARRPDIRFAAPMASPDLHAEFRRMAGPGGPEVALFNGQSRSVMSAADVVVLASGTASLEAMLLRRPMVVAWRGLTPTWFILRHWLGRNIRFVALPNLLAGRRIVPELLQDEVRPERLGPMVLRLLERGLSVEARWEFDRIHEELSSGEENAAAAVIALADRAHQLESPG